MCLLTISCPLLGPVSAVVTRLITMVAVPGSNPGTTGSGMGSRFIRSLTAARKKADPRCKGRTDLL